MSKKMRGAPDAVSEGDWISTYSDMVTLLLAFFILLFSMSTLNEEKLQEYTKSPDDEKAVGEQTKSGSGGDSQGQGDTVVEPKNFEELYNYLNNYIKNNNLSKSMSAYKGTDYVLLRFKSNIFFDPDSSVLKKEAKEILEKLCGAISGISNDIGLIKILGHTANIMTNSLYPISDRYLSSERANRVAEFIDLSNVVPQEKIVSIGYGKNSPIADNKTIDGQAQNRRVEILFLKTNSEKTTMDKLYKDIATQENSTSNETTNNSNVDSVSAKAQGNSDELTSQEVADLDRAK